MDRNGISIRTGVAWTFSISLPWYRETRLVLISFAGASIALFFGGARVQPPPPIVPQLCRGGTESRRTHAGTGNHQSRTAAQPENERARHLAAGIAHDFNNILSIIKGSAQIIRDLENREKVQTRVGRIKTVVEQGAGIVRAMLGFQPGIGPPGAILRRQRGGGRNGTFARGSFHARS